MPFTMGRLGICTSMLQHNRHGFADKILTKLPAHLCGELAHRRLGPLDGSASYRTYIIDALYHLSADALEKGARYEIC